VKSKKKTSVKFRASTSLRGVGGECRIGEYKESKNGRMTERDIEGGKKGPRCLSQADEESAAKGRRAKERLS